MLAIVESRGDHASTHICDHLRELADWDRLADADRADADGGGTWYRTDGAELRSFEKRHLDLERPVEAFACDPDVLVFASRHAGETGALLTGHFTGNVGPAEYGGDDHALAAACPNALAALLESFDEYAPAGYDIGLECTHHGPTDVGCPSLFAELGSGEEQWDDRAGAEAVARAILDLRGVPPHRERCGDSLAGSSTDASPRRQVVGFGGAHYVPRFERIVRETPWGVGHVLADWGLDALEAADPGEALRRRVVDRAFEASEAELAVVDGDRPDLEATVADRGYRVVSETWLREVGDRPLALVECVESALGPIEAGTRFGDARETDFRLLTLPAALVGALESVDREAARRALEAHAVAFETVEGATRLGSLAAVPDEPAAVDSLREEFLDVLRETYDDVRLEEGTIVARERAFDPERARERGVPEGPAFGALSSGESVTVDGEVVDPEDVHETRRHRFSPPQPLEEE